MASHSSMALHSTLAVAHIHASRRIQVLPVAMLIMLKTSEQEASPDLEYAGSASPS